MATDEQQAHSLVMLILDQSVEGEAEEALADMGLNHFTKLADVAGAGETGPRQGDPIWPGLNTVMLIYMPSDQIPAVVERLHAIRDSYPITPGMKFIVTPAVMY
ncbi:MAG TPA: hypothetical protein VGM19_02755 [Armatimonadota bacterium]|jgi:hypothetical protein